MSNFKTNVTATGIKITSTTTGSSVSVKHTPDGYIREKVMGNETEWFETPKEIANAGYLALAISRILPLIGKKTRTTAEWSIADKIKAVGDVIKSINVGTYRTLNNQLRQHFDNGLLLPNEEYRNVLFYEGAWRTGGQPKAAKAIVAAPAAKPAKKIKAATTPAVQKAKPAATPAAVKASKPATVKPTANKPKKATVKKVTPAAAPVADATPAPVDQDALAAEAEALIAADAPELIEVDADLAEA